MLSNRKGTREWVFQRVSNLLIICYAAVYAGLILAQGPMSYETWVAMHGAMWFKLYSTLTLVFIALNSVLAGWQIGTDYTQKVPLPGFGKLFHSFYFVVTLAYLGFAFFILWA